MPKPKIGITTSRHKATLAWLCDYWSVRLAGGHPVRLRPGYDIPNTEELDGLVIGGGDDISADLYQGEVALDVKIDPERDALERRLLDAALPRNIPILGICRGSQMINIHLGGTLHSDIYTTFNGKRKIRTVLPRMHVDIEHGSRLENILHVSSCKVNSLHHQSVNKLGDGLRIAARDQYGVIQATEHTQHPFLLGVQWHPEFLLLSKAQQGLFRALVEHTKTQNH